MNNFETQGSQVHQLSSVLVLIIGPGDITSRPLLSGRNSCCSVLQKKLCPQGCHPQRICLSRLTQPSSVTARQRTGSLSHHQPHPPHQMNRFFFLWQRLTGSKNPGTWTVTSYLFIVLEFLIVFLVSLTLEDRGLLLIVSFCQLKLNQPGSISVLWISRSSFMCADPLLRAV